MPKKPSIRKTTAGPKPKRRAPTRKTKPAVKKPATRPGGIAAGRTTGLTAVPGAMKAAALKQGQTRRIVHHCIAACAGTSNFSSNQPLSTIRRGIEQCVEACVIDAVHQPISIRSTDTEDLIVGRI